MSWFLRSQLIWSYTVFKAGYFRVSPFSMERVQMAFTHRIFDVNYLKQPTAGINALLFTLCICIISGPQQKLPQTLDLIIQHKLTLHMIKPYRISWNFPVQIVLKLCVQYIFIMHVNKFILNADCFKGGTCINLELVLSLPFVINSNKNMGKYFTINPLYSDGFFHKGRFNRYGTAHCVL